MFKNLKNLGWGVGGIAMLVGLALIAGFILRGGIWVVENYTNTINLINGIVFILILLLLLLSLIPRLRVFTGISIVVATKIWSVLFWVFCLFLTYQFWGLFWTVVGVLFFGVGVFATAFLALLLSGEWGGIVMVVLNFLIIFGVRFLGVWIMSKAQTKTNTSFVEAESSEEQTV